MINNLNKFLLVIAICFYSEIKPMYSAYQRGRVGRQARIDAAYRIRMSFLDRLLINTTVVANTLTAVDLASQVSVHSTKAA